MNADEFRHYILGFIFCKYLLEKLHPHANSILTEHGIDFTCLHETSEEGRTIVDAVSEACIGTLDLCETIRVAQRIANRG